MLTKQSTSSLNCGHKRQKRVRPGIKVMGKLSVKMEWVVGEPWSSYRWAIIGNLCASLGQPVGNPLVSHLQAVGGPLASCNLDVGEPWMGSGHAAHLLGWTISRHNLAIYWTYLGFVLHYFSKICLSHRYCDIHVFGNNFGTWTIMDKNWIALNPEIVHCLSGCSVTRW